MTCVGSYWYLLKICMSKLSGAKKSAFEESFADTASITSF
jgi:hypothetical protein